MTIECAHACVRVCVFVRVRACLAHYCLLHTRRWLAAALP